MRNGTGDGCCAWKTYGRRDGAGQRASPRLRPGSGGCDLYDAGGRKELPGEAGAANTMILLLAIPVVAIYGWFLTRTTTCPECRGDGLTPFANGAFSQCERCHGRGWIPKP